MSNCCNTSRQVSSAQPTRQNHYVPVWYQKGFLIPPSGVHQFMDIDPAKIQLSDGRVIVGRHTFPRAPGSCFWERDLYTTRFRGVISDEVEKHLFGVLDDRGAEAVRAFIGGDLREVHDYFQSFFIYLDAQKLRTPKGLDWIRSRYGSLTQLELMVEMQALRQMHCTMWSESVREIVSAEKSDVKFIVGDHPVTLYNRAVSLGSIECRYPSDPRIELVGTQTVFALDQNFCLILTNLEYAKNPRSADLKRSRTNARYFGRSLARTDSTIRSRELTSDQVRLVNQLIKARSRKYVAAGKKEWLDLMDPSAKEWDAIGDILIPPEGELWNFGGEIFIGYQDGTSHYQDAFGRTSPAHEFLKKDPPKSPLKPNDFCGCGLGRRYGVCCARRPPEDRPAWDVYSIRDRNLILIRAVTDILGLDQGKEWESVRRDISDEQVKRIHEVVEMVWPTDTDLPALLPRPEDHLLRALYLGVVDPRTVVTNVLAWLPYFDEIVILNPFVNGALLKPEFSPTKAPGSFKAQTLKNAFLLLMLEPFIRLGIVHLVPDPGDFNFDFQRAILKMARERAGDEELDDCDLETLGKFGREDYMRAIRALPAESLRRIIANSAPQTSEAEIDGIVEYLKRQHEDDPFAVLQPIPQKGGSFQIMKSFNLELGLFVAQLTGSVLYTDLQFHWRHIHQSRDITGRLVESKSWPHFAPVVDRVRGISFLLSTDLEALVRTRADRRLEDVRSNLGNVVRLARLGDLASRNEIKDVVGAFHRTRKNIRREWMSGNEHDERPLFVGKVELSIPNPGIERTTVNRMLVTFAPGRQVTPVPMVMKFDATALPNKTNHRPKM